MTEPGTSISILLIDDEAMIRAGLRALLELAGFQVVGESGDARGGILLAEELRPDVVVLDIAMPGMSGLDAVGPIKRASPGTKVLIASQHEGHSYVRQALEAGADGYLSKASDPQDLRAAVEAVRSGESFLSPRLAGTFDALRPDGLVPATGVRLDRLTPREREVFQLIAVGRANKEIAQLLGLELATVKKHRENLQRKLDCHSAAEIARLAIREGLLHA